MTEGEYVLALDDARAGELALAGGKGASLGRLFAAGLPVPPGFVLATTAYQRLVRDNDLDSGLNEALESVDASQPASLEAASRAIDGMIARAQMPQTVADEIRRAYAELGGDELRVAIRSSATAEDLPGLSFA